MNRLSQKFSSRSQEFNILLKDAEQQWRHYLLDPERRFEDFTEIHLLITDIVEGHSDVIQWNRYLIHGVDATIASSPTECLVYAKFLRFMFFGWITPRDKNLWKNTRINREGGIFFTQKQTMCDESVNNFIVGRAQAVDTCFEKLSPNEKEKIAKFCEENFDKILDSDLGRALNADYGIGRI